MVFWIRHSLPNFGVRVQIPLLDLRLGWGTYVPCNPSLWEAEIISGISIDDAVYPWWGLDALSNERRLAGRL